MARDPDRDPDRGGPRRRRLPAGATACTGDDEPARSLDRGARRHGPAVRRRQEPRSRSSGSSWNASPRGASRPTRPNPGTVARPGPGRRGAASPRAARSRSSSPRRPPTIPVPDLTGHDARPRRRRRCRPRASISASPTQAPDATTADAGLIISQTRRRATRCRRARSSTSWSRPGRRWWRVPDVSRRACRSAARGGPDARSASSWS